VFAFSVVPQKAQLGAQALHLIEQIEHGFEPGKIEAVNGSQALDSQHSINRLFREFHHAIRRLKDRSYQAGGLCDLEACMCGSDLWGVLKKPL
jgi:gamma-glutamyl:cysteine ligase YbdK (ATP-grasp superfamily)